MGGKHLKKLRAEKSKVHLKKTKLPRGQNVTDTTFKVKKIQLVEQLKKVNEGEPVSNWNVPLKDLLIRLNHYNFTSRLNGLYGIKELLVNYPEILQGPSLKSLVLRLLDLLTDEEHKIRMTAMNLLSYLFESIPVSAIFPFQDVLNVHMGCAMTHRNMSVQWDSLNFIDVMIKHSPGAIKHNFGALAQNFIRILKKFFNESHGLPSGRSKENLEKSKVEMFSRFYQFMNIGFSEITVANQYFGNSVNVTDLGRKKISLRESNNQYKQIPDLSSLFVNSESKSTTLSDKNNEELQLISSLIMPLIFETWMEYCPDKRLGEATSECILSDRIASLLCVILKIIMSLYERSMALEGGRRDCWFAAGYSSAFKKCFLSVFPYLPTVSRKKSSSSKPGEFPSPSADSYILHNLIICYLSYSFELVLENNGLGALMENYISFQVYLQREISSKFFVEPITCSVCADGLKNVHNFCRTGVLRRSIATETEMLLKVVEAARNVSDHKHASVILGKVVDAYDGTQDAGVRRELSKTLMKVVLEENESLWRTEESIVKWMRSLPGRICEPPIFVEIIETILGLVNRPEGAAVLKEVDRKAFEILHNLPNFKIDGIAEFEGHKMIASILYRCDSKVIEELLWSEVLNNGPYSQNLNLKNYITNIFHYKLTTLSAPCHVYQL